MAEEGALGGEEFPTFRAGQAVHVTVHAATVTGLKLIAAPTVRIKETLGERFPQSGQDGAVTCCKNRFEVNSSPDCWDKRNSWGKLPTVCAGQPANITVHAAAIGLKFIAAPTVQIVTLL